MSRPVERRFRAAAAVLSLAAIACSLPALAGGTEIWTESAVRIARGQSEGLALSRRGRLFLAPRIVRIDGPLTAVGPVQVWAMASARDSAVYFGTGPRGQILELGRSAQPRPLFQVEEPMVTALAVTPDGEILAGTAPGGVVYRIGRDGTGGPWAETGERYVWSLAVSATGSVYAGTGERGKIFRISESGEAELLFDSDESHVVSLLAPEEGGLLAGGSGRGLIYRLDEEGHALVLHDDDLPEVVALDVEPGGAVLAAIVAPPGPAAPRPALRLQLPDGAQVGSRDEAVGMLEEGSGPTLRGFIEGLGRPEERPPDLVQGRLVRIDAAGSATELWSSNTEAPFCLARDERGRALFGTGEPARLYRVESDGDVARLATLPEAQLSGLLAVGRRIFASTSNPAVAYRLDGDVAETGTFTSRPHDAGGPARWGSIRWRVENPEGRTELYTRTGNSHEPDETWSAWSPALTHAEGSPVVNPDGRFLQWRLRQIGGKRAATYDVSVPYEPYNRAPALSAFRLEPRARGGATKSFRWTSRDPDGDPLQVTIEYRPRGSAGWAVAAVRAPDADGPEPRRRDEPREGRLDWDTAELPEGRYEVRAVASDQPANAAGEGLSATAEMLLQVVVDRTPPELELFRLADGGRGVRLADALSEIDRLELLVDGRTRFTARPEDGVCDSPKESFRLSFPDPAALEPWTLRGTDAAGNSVSRALEPGEDAN